LVGGACAWTEMARQLKIRNTRVNHPLMNIMMLLVFYEHPLHSCS
jgi:hypothetical protein